MLYVSSFKNNLYGITDMEDYTEEFYSYDDLMRFKKAGLHIWGISGKTITPTTPDTVLNFMRFRYKDFKIHLVNGLLELVKYTGSQERVVIPRGIEIIGDDEPKCFENRNAVIIDIPNTVVRLASKCFKECSNLERVIFRGGLKYIGDNCFDGCTSLREIKIPYGVERIGSYSFRGCERLSKVELPSTVTQLYIGCFLKCISLESIALPDELKFLPEYCFQECTNLVSVKLPKSLKKIGYSCFLDCVSLRKLDIVSKEDSLIIESNAFDYCNLLSSLKVTCNKLIMDLNELGYFTEVSILEYIEVNSGCDISEVKLDRTDRFKLLWRLC